MTAFIAALGLYLFFGAVLWWQQDRLLYPAPRTHGALPFGYERIELQTDDGLTLPAAFAPASPGKPIIVHFHGNGGNLAGAAYEMIGPGEAGFGRLLVSYRGYGGNPGKPSEEGFYRDGRAALNWLAGQGVGPDRFVLSGNSIGAGTAVQMALEFRPAALVLTSPFTSLPDIAGEKMPLYPARWLVRDSFDNLSKIRQVAAPVLIVHGSADRLIPPDHGRALAEAADGTLVLVPGAGHDMSFRPEAQRIIVDWLDGLPDDQQ